MATSLPPTFMPCIRPGKTSSGASIGSFFMYSSSGSNRLRHARRSLRVQQEADIDRGLVERRLAEQALLQRAGVERGPLHGDAALLGPRLGDVAALRFRSRPSASRDGRTRSAARRWPGLARGAAACRARAGRPRHSRKLRRSNLVMVASPSSCFSFDCYGRCRCSSAAAEKLPDGVLRGFEVMLHGAECRIAVAGL